MPRFPYETVDVFTDRAFGGNPLAIFTDARGLSDTQMQALAAEMNYSETTFVLPAEDPANDARVRIFHRTAEMPFAGHPNVGTAYVLARHGRDRDGVLRFEQKAGLVEIAGLRRKFRSGTRRRPTPRHRFRPQADRTALPVKGADCMHTSPVLSASCEPSQCRSRSSERTPPT